MTPTKVYEVKIPFEANGLAYEVGQKYELADDLVATLAEGTVVEYVPEVTAPEVEATADGAPTPAGEVVENTEAAPEAPVEGVAEEESWVGNHTVGRD